MTRLCIWVHVNILKSNDMEPQTVVLQNKGMVKDYSISKSPEGYAFDNLNIRILPNQDNTGLSVTNEKGPLLCEGPISKRLIINTVNVSVKKGCVVFSLDYNTASELPVMLTVRTRFLAGVNISVDGCSDTFYLTDEITDGYIRFHSDNGVEYNNTILKDVYALEKYKYDININSPVLYSKGGGECKINFIVITEDGGLKVVTSYKADDYTVSREAGIPKGVKTYQYDIANCECISYNLVDKLDTYYDDTYIYMLSDTYKAYKENGKTLPEKVIYSHNNIVGKYCGSCQTQDGVVIFTHGDANDYIYYIKPVDDTSVNVEQLYRGRLNLDENHRVETLFHFENENIQKVYWVDGVNQPRVINLNGDINDDNDETQFNFIPMVNNLPNMEIEKEYNSTGLFPAGTIQYGLSYYNKFGSETKMLWMSTVHYITYSDRAAKADEVVTCSFKLHLFGLDKKFDYVRIYSAIRTSLDTTPIVSIVGDYEINGDKLIVYDNNIGHTSVSASLLDYIGGQEFIAGTIAAKQDRLFLGDITLTDNASPTALRKTAKSLMTLRWNKTDGVTYDADTISFGYKTIGTEIESELYPYRLQTMCGKQSISYFKYGEIYRFAIQFQTKTGAWSNPLWIGDKKCMLRPQTDILNKRIKLPTAMFEWNSKLNSVTKDYAKYRILIAETTPATRSVVAQGVLSPTVFTLNQRNTNAPYAVPSWIMRAKGDVASSLGESTYDEVQSMDSSVVPYFDKDEYNAKQGEETGTVIAIYTARNSKNTHYWYNVLGAEKTRQLQRLESKSFFGLGTYLMVLAYSYTGDKIDSDSFATYVDARMSKKNLYKKMCNWIKENLNTDFSDDVTLSNFKMYFCYKSEANYNYNFGNWVYKIDEDDPVLDAANLYGIFKADGEKSINALMNLHYRKINTTLPITQNNSYSTNIDNNGYFVDDSVLTFNSPDLESNQDLVDNSNLKMRIIGYIPITAGSSDVDIDVDTKGLSDLACTGNLDESHIVSNISSGFRTLTNAYLYQDRGWLKNKTNDRLYPSDNICAYRIFMWHKSGSLNGLNTITWPSPEGDEQFSYTPSNLKNKIFATKRFSLYNVFFDKPVNVNITSPTMVYDDNAMRTIDGCGGNLYYSGNVDSLLTRRTTTTGIYAKNIDTGYDVEYNKAADDEVYVNAYDPVRIKYRSSTHAVFAMTDGSTTYYRLPELGYSPSDPLPSNNNYPWIKPAWIADDDYVFVGLYKSVESAKEKFVEYKDRLSKFIGKVMVMAIPYVSSSRYSKYYIVKLENGIVTINEPDLSDAADGDDDNTPTEDIYGTPMRLGFQPQWEYSYPRGAGMVKLDELHNMYWRAEGEVIKYEQLDFSKKEKPSYPYLYLAELYRDIPYSSLYGGTEDVQIQNINWVVSSSPVKTTYDTKHMGGDTFYQRWDCLKTYPYTEEDVNSVVDVTSFMVESHTNLDGRCDVNRKSLKLTLIRPTNYNLFNTAYNQTDNIFNYKSLDSKFDLDRFSNMVAWSNAKLDTNDIDDWTNINMLSSLSLDGSCGDITRLVNFNDTLLAFQTKAVNAINYNNPTQLSTETGSPVEIVNSGLVNGYTKLTDNNGCQYKWSICKGGSGLFFVDNLKKAVFSFSKNGMAGVSSKGFSQWFKDNLDDYFDLMYDQLTHNMYFVNKKWCLAFDEELDAFSSFYSYEGMKDLFDMGGYTYAIPPDDRVDIYRLRGGGYGYTFANKTAPYHVEYKVNPEPLVDKIFTNIEYTADVIDGNVDDVNYKKGYPFKKLDIWNEYQKGSVDLTKQRNPLQYDNARKFRIWRTQLPRDEMSKNKLDRIRNTWVYLKLDNEEPSGEKVVLHNLWVKYYK